MREYLYWLSLPHHYFPAVYFLILLSPSRKTSENAIIVRSFCADASTDICHQHALLCSCGADRHKIKTLIFEAACYQFLLPSI